MLKLLPPILPTAGDSMHSAHVILSSTSIINSGASSHIFPDWAAFMTYSNSTSNISSFSASSSSIVGCGTVQISMALLKKAPFTVILHDACHTSSVIMSIISVSRLDECDDTYTLFGNRRSVTFKLDDEGTLMNNTIRSRDVLFTGTKCTDRLYYMDMPC